jgi:RimJ/RimL family protein N-acetyltransferase
LTDSRTKLPYGTGHLALQGDRITLRRPVMADARAIAVLANDRRVAENSRRIPFPYRLQDAEQFLVAAAESAAGSVFVIERGQKELIGVCRLDATRGKAPELGLWLGHPYWGRGYGTEAACLLIRHAFTGAAIDEIVACVRITNPASRRALEKCGFEWSGVELHRILALRSSVPVDRLILRRRIWEQFDEQHPVRRVA